MNTTANPVPTAEEIAAADARASGMTARELISRILETVDDLDTPVYLRIIDLDANFSVVVQDVQVFDSDPEDPDGETVYPTIIG
jgi:hypothetical protein